jgi:hypothetical protein
MTPKHKAEELFDKMSTNNGDEYHHCTYYVAKQCALIAVDEILNTIMSVYQPETKLFWIEVKKEIEAL